MNLLLINRSKDNIMYVCRIFLTQLKVHMLKLPAKILLVLAALIFPAITLLANAADIPLDGIVAVVNDEVVMTSELEIRLQQIYRQLEKNGTAAPPRETLVPQVLDRLVLERIQLLKGRQVGIRFSDAEVNDTLDAMAKKQNITLDELVENAHQDGITLANLRQQIRNELIINRVQEGSMNRRITITEQSIDNFLRSEEGRSWSSPDVNLGHILLPLSAGAPRDEVTQIQNKASELYQQAKNGADFKSLAIAHSSGQNALNGGDLGWRDPTQLPDLFVSAIKNLSPGQVSVPIRSDAGYHLLKLYERRGSNGQVVVQNNVRHILLEPSEIRSPDETHEAIKAIRKQAAEGKDFGALAKKYSDDIGSAMSGGELGWSVPGQFVPLFEEIMNNIEINEVSEPFETQFGWHILQVTKRREQDFTEEIKRSQARNIIKQRRFQEELQIWLQEIRDEAFVEIKL